MNIKPCVQDKAGILKRIVAALPALALTALLFSGCSPKGAASVSVWLSRVNDANTGMEEALSPGKAVEPAGKGTQADYAITIDVSRKYQQMDGFGASFTDASAWLVVKKLDKGARDKLMESLFDKENGIGISMLRQPIGACDHVLAPYTYDDKPDSDTLPNFTIAHDEGYIIPAIQQAMGYEPGRVSVMAATWSPPGWMKANDSELGMRFGKKGTLLPNKYTAYANYLAKFILAYGKAGIPIYATTIQNEPMYASAQWPAMLFMPNDEAAFIKGSLAPAFKAAGIGTKIICFDHNFDSGEAYVSVVMKDPETSALVAGSAWHWYGGTPDAMTRVHDKYPGKGIWFTEGSGGEWDPVKRWRDGFDTQMRNVISLTRNWSKSVVWWNVALDENNGPDFYYDTYAHTDSTCRGLVTIDSKTGAVQYNADYYTLGHISKFVDPGAWRAESDTYDGKLEDAAFVNPDGSTVLVAYNPSGGEARFTVKAGGVSFAYALRPGEAATFKWNK